MSPSKAALDALRIERGAETRPPRRALPAALVGAAVVVALAGAWWSARPKAVEVRTAAAREAAVSGADRTVLNASGYVTARRQATISSKITGKVTEVLVEEGLRVKEGQV
ncbi:MAG TPA: biotin/lipoyl-binding protein, partial [Opitutaceae bacterium]|nr:biotin/lipoyl-binding protein [Opitutaceae bacterium]